MKFLFSLYVFLVLVSACNQDQKNSSFHLEEKALVFKTNFPAYNLNYFRDSHQREFVSFADFVTFKKISFHSLDNKQKWSVSLVSLMNTEKVTFIHYHVISADSILLLTKYTNQFFLINRKAEIIKKTNFSNLLLKGIELAPPIYFEKDQLYSAIHHYPIEDLKTKSDLKVWDTECLKKAIIAQTQINFQKNPPEYVGRDLISRFMKSDQLPAEGTHFILNKSTIYYYSAYCDTLYSITEKGNTPLLKVKSTIGKIHVTPSTREQYNKNNNCINEAYLQQSFICDVLFDNQRNLMYVFVRKPKKGENFPFNILVYDQKLKKLNELEFDGTKYYTSGFVGERGLYLLRNYGKHPNQKSFDLLNYEK